MMMDRRILGRSGRSAVGPCCGQRGRPVTHVRAMGSRGGSDPGTRSRLRHAGERGLDASDWRNHAGRQGTASGARGATTGARGATTGARGATTGARGATRGAAAAAASGDAPTAPGPLASLANAISSYFPLVVVSSALLGVFRPAALTWVPASWMSPFLGLSMLGMGLTLTFADFQRVLAAPKNILLGVCLQYSVMPSLAFVISRALVLPLDLTIGLCIVGACPGGSASNIVTYLAKADVPLSVAMTTASTLGAVIMTPMLTSLLLGTLVQVDALGLLLSTVQVVLLPVALGTVLNQAFPKTVERLTPLSTLSAVLLIAVICGRVVAENSGFFASLQDPRVLLGVFLLHAGGFALGYALSKLVRMEEKAARTNSIEVGMQNSALGAMLATQHFGAMHPLAAVPCAISAVMHSCMGSLLAAYWYVILSVAERWRRGLLRHSAVFCGILRHSAVFRGILRYSVVTTISVHLALDHHRRHRLSVPSGSTHSLTRSGPFVELLPFRGRRQDGQSL